MTHPQQKGQEGQILLPIALTLITFLGLAGLAIDLVKAYVVKSALTTAVDGAILAAARAPESDMAQVADKVFKANIPDGYMTAGSPAHTEITNSSGLLTLSGTVSMPTTFMRVFGYNALTINARAEAQRMSSGPGSNTLLIIDEDTIDNGIGSLITFCTASQVDKCTNDDIANPGVRTKLFTRDTDRTPHTGLVLPAGQIGDEGLFRFDRPGTQVSQQNGAEFTLQEFIDAAGDAANENNLDKIEDVTPLRHDDIVDLIGKTVCAVVYDSDVSVDLSAHNGVLKGSTMGLTAFVVTGTSGGGGSTLPSITVDLLPAANIAAACSAAATAGSSPSGESGSETPPILVK